jgi:hypothetical protein
MKSYFLSPIASHTTATRVLNALLPGQTSPWLLKDAGGDVIAYFQLDDLEEPDMRGVLTISADISGRRFYCDAEVMAVLQRLKAELGGEITDDS